jgi:ribosomal protein L7/L12
MTANEVPPQFDALERDARDLLAEGEDINTVISFLHQQTGIIGTIWVIRQTLGISLKETRDLVELSPALNPEGHVPQAGWCELVLSLGLH